MHDGKSSSPAEDATTAIASREWLDPFGGIKEGRRIAELEARLAGDSELVYRLMFAGYDGPEWVEVANRLAAYGLRVIMAWILDGTIASHCRSKLLPAPWSTRCRERSEAENLAADTVSEAIIHFRDDVLKLAKWSPDRGASLSTYFIGQCLIRWANVMRAWKRGQRSSPVPEAHFERPDERVDCDRVLDRLHAENLLAEAPPITAAIIRLRAEGYTWEEISELTGSSIGRARGLYVRFQRAFEGGVAI